MNEVEVANSIEIISFLFYLLYPMFVFAYFFITKDENMGMYKELNWLLNDKKKTSSFVYFVLVLFGVIPYFIFKIIYNTIQLIKNFYIEWII